MIPLQDENDVMMRLTTFTECLGSAVMAGSGEFSGEKMEAFDRAHSEPVLVVHCVLQRRVKQPKAVQHSPPKKTGRLANKAGFP
jgi:hypothetical protein